MDRTWAPVFPSVKHLLLKELVLQEPSLLLLDMMDVVNASPTCLDPIAINVLPKPSTTNLNLLKDVTSASVWESQTNVDLPATEEPLLRSITEEEIKINSKSESMILDLLSALQRDQIFMIELSILLVSKNLRDRHCTGNYPRNSSEIRSLVTEEF